MNAVDPYRLIINDDYEKLFQALCRGLPMPDGVSLQDLVDDLRMAARTLTEEWDQAVRESRLFGGDGPEGALRSGRVPRLGRRPRRPA